MADLNPAKRRKISPSTDASIVDAPSSPNKIPVPDQNIAQLQDGMQHGTTPRRPSFASPTKASLARHNPQIMQRIGQSGRSESVNTDAYVRANEVNASIENALKGRENTAGSSQVPQTSPIQGESGEGYTETQSQVQKQAGRSGTGLMASAPRRRSRTPGEIPPQAGVDPSRNASEILKGEQLNVEQREPLNTNVFGGVTTDFEQLAGPVRRSALRRSPPGGFQSQSESQLHSQSQFSPTENPTAANIGIVRRPALRRSPPTASQSQFQPQSSGEKIAVSSGSTRKSALRRSPQPVSSQIQDQIPSQFEPVKKQAESEFQPEPVTEPAHDTASTHVGYTQPDEVAEPELPPTPVQRGLEDPVVTTPPTGIHDTPSKRISKKPSKPSPLKQQFQTQSQLQSFSSSMATKSLLKPYSTRSVPAEASILEDAPAQPASGQDEDSEITGASRHGPRPPFDKHATKRKLRDELLRELQELQADISLAEAETERIYNLHESSSEVEAMALNQSEIEELLKRSGYGNEKDEQEVNEIKSTRFLSSFHALSSFMPFSGPLTRQLPAPTKDENPILSHMPLPQDDPLPYLRLFTPLQFSSVITVIPSYSDPDASIVSTSTTSSTEILKDIIQCHTITARSTASSALFRSTISILINTTTFSISSIKINSLSPAAKPELGSFLQEIASARDDDVLAGNAAVSFWAMGRWYEVAKKRAILWVRVEEEFGPKSGFALKLRKRKGVGEKAAKQRDMKKKDIHEDAEEGARDQAGNAAVVNIAKDIDEDGAYKKLTRKEYLANMGRQSTTLSIPIPSPTTPNINLRVEWKISFDWTGEVENSVSIGILGGKVGGWPGSWREADTRNCLSKLPSTFERMVRERGPLNAIRGIVELLDGNED